MICVGRVKGLTQLDGRGAEYLVANQDGIRDVLGISRCREACSHTRIGSKEETTVRYGMLAANSMALILKGDSHKGRKMAVPLWCFVRKKKAVDPQSRHTKSWSGE